MKIFKKRVYVVSILGRTFRICFPLLVLAYCYHSYKDKVSHSQISSFRYIGSYVPVR